MSQKSSKWDMSTGNELLDKLTIPEDAPLWQRNEGRRLFDLCLKHGATPGNVHQWLQKKLESIHNLENQVSNAGWEREFYQRQARDMNNEGWK